MAVGGLPEKIITAFESVLEEQINEEAALNKCNAALQNVGKIEEDVEKALAQGKGFTLKLNVFWKEERFKVVKRKLPIVKIVKKSFQSIASLTYAAC